MKAHKMGRGGGGKLLEGTQDGKEEEEVRKLLDGIKDGKRRRR